MKEFLVSHLGGKCSVCGYDKCMRSLSFHHLDPGEKDFVVSNRWNLGVTTILAEVQKCILVCANCHSEIHERQDAESRSGDLRLKISKIRATFEKKAG